MLVEPYLDFNGRCEEAVEFYRQAIGAEVQALLRFKDAPEAMCAPESLDKVMHACLKVGDRQLMASDGRCTGQPATFSGISLTLTADNVPQAEKFFKALSEGGQAFMPLSETFFAKTFGMTVDKFGVPWMVIVPKPM